MCVCVCAHKHTRINTCPPWMPGVISALYCRLCYCALTHPLHALRSLCLPLNAQQSFVLLSHFALCSFSVASPSQRFFSFGLSIPDSCVLEDGRWTKERRRSPRRGSRRRRTEGWRREGGCDEDRGVKRE